MFFLLSKLKRNPHNIYWLNTKMTTARAFTYNTGAPIAGTQQVGDLAVGTPTIGFPATDMDWWNGPDEELGYVIAHTSPSGNQPNPLFKPAYVGFWRSPLLTEASFIGLAEYVSATVGPPQVFTAGTEANTWLTANGFWSSYQDVWTFLSGSQLPWPNSTAGYSTYNGSITNFDDGYGNDPLTASTNFIISTLDSNLIYIQTNGYLIVGNPTDTNGAFFANNGDLWLEPGTTNSDGDTENWWYQTGTEGNKYYQKNIVYGGKYPGNSAASSYVLNLYKDSQYQYLETRVKANSEIFGRAGVSGFDTRTASTRSQVWQGDLTGNNWNYLGYGTIV